MTTKEFYEIVKCVLEIANDCDLFSLISEYEKFLTELKEKERQN